MIAGVQKCGSLSLQDNNNTLFCPRTTMLCQPVRRNIISKIRFENEVVYFKTENMV